MCHIACTDLFPFVYPGVGMMRIEVPSGPVDVYNVYLGGHHHHNFSSLELTRQAAAADRHLRSYRTEWVPTVPEDVAFSLARVLRLCMVSKTPEPVWNIRCCMVACSCCVHKRGSPTKIVHNLISEVKVNRPSKSSNHHETTGLLSRWCSVKQQCTRCKRASTQRMGKSQMLWMNLRESCYRSGGMNTCSYSWLDLDS